MSIQILLYAVIINQRIIHINKEYQSRHQSPLLLKEHQDHERQKRCMWAWETAYLISFKRTDEDEERREPGGQQALLPSRREAIRGWNGKHGHGCAYKTP